jgi:hypothetical protein
VSETPRVQKHLLVAFLLTLVLVGCGEKASGGKPGGAEAEGTSHAGGSTVSEGAEKAELEPAGDSDTSGIATFEEVGELGVEVDLEVEGLPEPGTTYYAHIHEGGCADVPAAHGDHEQHEEARTHGRVGVALALVRPERFLTWGSGPEYAHGGHNHGHEHEAPPNEDLPGNVGSPLPLGSSNTGTGSVTSVLRGVTLEQLWSRDPRYRLEVHPSGPEDAPVLACGTLGEAA